MKDNEERLQKIERELFLNNLLGENVYLKNKVKEIQKCFLTSKSCIKERESEIERLKNENEVYRDAKQHAEACINLLNCQLLERNEEIHNLKEEVQGKDRAIRRHEDSYSKIFEELQYKIREIRDQAQQMSFLKAKLNRFLDGESNRSVHAWEVNVEQQRVKTLEKEIKELATKLVEQEEITKQLRIALEISNGNTI